MIWSKVKLVEKFNFGQVLVIGGESLDAGVVDVLLCNEHEDVLLNIQLRLEVNQIVIDPMSKFEVCEIKRKSDSQHFTLSIMASDGKFHISYDDELICHFDGFKPDIKIVRVVGAMKKIYQIDHRRVFPDLWPVAPEGAFEGYYDFSHDIPRKFEPGMKISMNMIVGGAKDGRVVMRMMENGTDRQLFHFNARFDEGIIIMNSMVDETEFDEDSELRVDQLPITHGEEFNLTLTLMSSGFAVGIKGHHLGSFGYDRIKENGNSEVQMTDLFDKLVGFKIHGENDTTVRVLELIHSHN